LALLGAGKKGLAGIRFASIGPVTSSTLRELGLEVDVEAKEFTIPGLIEAVVQLMSDSSKAET
jgi:uroporphyrinogen-III synthase